MTLVVRDDQSRGDQARTLAEQLITVNKVHWLNGEGTSGNTSIIQPVVESYGIPMSCHACASPTLTAKGFKWFWRTGPNDGTMVASVFQFLKEWPANGGPKDLKTIALFTCDNLFCQDNRKIAVDLAPKSGLKIVADTINRAKSVDPAALAKAANETNMTPEMMIIDYKGIKFGTDHQNQLATGVVTQVGWDNEKHTIWPWDLAKQAGFKPISPSPGWEERESRAVGLTIIWGLMEMINFAHGEFMMLGMFGAWGLSVSLGWDPLISMVPLAVIMYGAGVLVYRQLMRRVQRGEIFTQIFATVGLFFFIQNGVVALFLRLRVRHPDRPVPAPGAVWPLLARRAAPADRSRWPGGWPPSWPSSTRSPSSGAATSTTRPSSGPTSSWRPAPTPRRSSPSTSSGTRGSACWAQWSSRWPSARWSPTRSPGSAVTTSPSIFAAGGVLYGFWALAVFPDQVLEVNWNILPMMAAVVGGLGRLGGPVLGSIILIPISQLMTATLGAGQLAGRGIDLIIYGAVIMLIASWRPNGLLSLPCQLHQRGAPSRRGSHPAPGRRHLARAT
jgi:branched-subunit amino acid ABC-type transport system permease component